MGSQPAETETAWFISIIVLMYVHMCTLADPGGTTGMHPSPQQDPILSFLHMFLLKSICV